LRLLRAHPREHRDDGGALLGGDVAGDEADVVAREGVVVLGDFTASGGVARGRVWRQCGVRHFCPRYSGMLPCFLAGSSSRLPRSPRSALMTARRVPAGSSTLSSSPRSAARNGEVTSEAYLAVSSARSASTSSPRSAAAASSLR